MDIITAITPTKVDDSLLYKLRKGLDVATSVLNINSTCNQSDLSERLVCFIHQLKHISPELRDAVYSKMASKIASVLDDAELDSSDYDTLVQLQYVATKAK